MESSAVHLRSYEPADFETLYRVDQACFPPGIAYGRIELRSYLRSSQRSEGSCCLLAEIAGGVAGFILTRRSDDFGYVITLDVLELYRRRKVGTLLLEAAEREAASHGARRMVLETATTNKPAIALWKKHGYREVATIESYYGYGQDAFEMEKVLEPKSPDKTLP